MVDVEFAASPSAEGLLKLRKDDRIAVWDKLGIEIGRSYRKTQIARIIVEYMVNNDVFDDNVLSQFSTETPEFSQSQVEIKKARIKARQKGRNG